MKLRALIVDDEPLGREAVRSLLGRDPQVSEIMDAANGLEAVNYLEAGKADVIFLDVRMPDLDGLSVLRQARIEEMPAVVFVTAHEEYAVEAFESDAVDYLLKPVAGDRFARMLERVKSRLRAKHTQTNDERVAQIPESMPVAGEPLRRIAVKSRGKTVFIRAEDVDWIRAADDFVELHVGREDYLLHTTLGGLAAKLDPQMFMRIHRSVVVNIRSIRELSPGFHGEYTMTLHNEIELRSGRAYHQAMRRLLSNSL